MSDLSPNMEMYLKTPLKRLCKLLPLRTQAAQVAETIHLEDEQENIVPEPVPNEVPLSFSEARSDTAPKETALPQETLEELKARIRRTWKYLLELDRLPQLDHHPATYYPSDAVDPGEAREFADYLAREMLKAEREKKE